MIELIVYSYLDTTLSEDVFMTRPENPPDTYVLIEKTGSSKNDFVESAVFAFQSYAPTLYEAAVLNENVKAAVEDMLSLDEISKVTLNTDYNFTDTSTKQPRYQAVYEVVFF